MAQLCKPVVINHARCHAREFLKRFKGWLKGWHSRGYRTGIPDYAPPELEKKHWAPSWRRLAKVLLRNDWWCKGLGMTQPKSAAYARYMQLKRAK
jgi:predicted phosphoadenosine phosphosulfate sulfurtransferase